MPVTSLDSILADSSLRLSQARVPTQFLAEFVPEGRRLWVFPRPATMRPLGEVWRLGVFLLSVPEGPESAPGRRPTLMTAGPVTTARERGRQGYQSLSQEERRDVQAAAFRGGYAPGRAVTFAAQPIDLDACERACATGTSLDDGALLVREGRALARWRPDADAGSCPPLERYLAERLDLLTQ